MKDTLQPGQNYSQMYDKEPQYNKHNLKMLGSMTSHNT